MHYSDAKPGNAIIDGTIGFGGHAFGLIEKIMPGGKYLGIDKDQRSLDYSKTRLHEYKDMLTLANGRISNLELIAKETGFEQVDVILLDLGVSSPQLDDPEYGISFKSTGPLDMRIGVESDEKTAADIINHTSAHDLKKLFTEHGQPATNRLVDEIIARRDKQPFTNIEDLLELIVSVVPREKGIHPATRVMQALRVEVNQEEQELTRGLEQAVRLLKTGGRLLVISFHSGEDRIVKEFFRTESKDCICPPEYPICQCDHKATLRIVSDAIQPSVEEITDNPRSRSAVLRVAAKI